MACRGSGVRVPSDPLKELPLHWGFFVLNQISPTAFRDFFAVDYRDVGGN